MTLTFPVTCSDHQISQVPFPIYVLFIVTKYYLQLFSRKWAANILGSRPWPIKVTWRHWTRDHSIRHMPFPIGVSLEPSLYLQPFLRYLHPNISVWRPW